MAKNSNGEIETAPGAHRREKASCARDLAAAFREMADSHHNLGALQWNAYLDNPSSRALLNRVEPFVAHTMLQKAPGVREHYDLRDHYNLQAHKKEREASWHSTVASFQTAFARLKYALCGQSYPFRQPPVRANLYR